ncbi:MAG: AMP-binding protein [Pirellulaceae bacterium]|jgi:fatty-acyl-CoA synthase|nr:AMP-binding protein [Pirellulaceae bacterium]MDP7016665.1 AMP-binding protein [Pirellulaceae bacterium]
MSNDTWVDGLTIGAVLGATAERHGDRDALVFPQLDRRWTWSELLEDVDRTAQGLVRAGVEKGHHVAIWATNVPEWVMLQFATARIGAVLVTINPAYRAAELQYVLRQSDARMLVLQDQFKSSDYFAMLAAAVPELADCAGGRVQSENYPLLKTVVSIPSEPPAWAMTWDDLVAGGGDDVVDFAARLSAPTAADPINIQYTSGTTGFPKAAMLSHRNLLLNAFYIGQCQEMTSADRICIPVPFYHCFGCVLGTLCAAVYGAAMIIPGKSFVAAETLDAVEAERASVIYGVPTMFIAELEDQRFAERDLSSLRTGIMAGSPCPIEIMKQVIDRMGARQMTIAYGQTEASPVVTQTRVGDPLELRVETVGRPIPDVEIKIIDPDTGMELGDNQQGELCSRGHVVMIGYYQNEEATRAAIDDQGWLHSGDLAVRLPNGYYRITGRIKDMVIRGGENIYPREIEEFLFTHDDVEQSSVVGVPDEKYGEELCAWVKLKAGGQLTESDLRAYCKANLAHYKVPRYVRLVSEFPQTVTGKIQKFKIREIMVAELGLSEPETA